MKYIILISALMMQMFSGALFAAKGETLFANKEQPLHIFVNNRILAKVNGKAISVIDVMKKMDVMFYKQFPQFATSVEARHQFYEMSWKRILKDLIDKELVIAEAGEFDIKISNGDVRQEMETLFGPNIILNLDKVGLTYDEAWKMIHGDLVIRKMMSYRANSKALRRVTPSVVREAYDQFAKENVNTEQWKYTVVSIRDADPVHGEEIANNIYLFLVDKSIALSDLPNKIKEMHLPEATKVTVSEEFHHGEKELSPPFREVLSTMGDGMFSKPVAHKSRNNSIVYRIFYLKEMIPAGAIPFFEMENKLKDQLLDKALDEETDLYLKRLRQHFSLQEIQETLPENFQPFILK